jgi:hypothetical protein
LDAAEQQRKGDYSATYREMSGVSMDTFTYIPYIQIAMLPKFTTYVLLTAITLQGVFGGLQTSVSICLGGGHEHEVEEVVEQCALACSHSSDWATPITQEDIQDCSCTDLEFGLVVLLTTPRNTDLAMKFVSLAPAIELLVDNHAPRAWRGPPLLHDDDIGMMRRIAVIRTTRLRV